MCGSSEEAAREEEGEDAEEGRIEDANGVGACVGANANGDGRRCVRAAELLRGLRLRRRGLSLGECNSVVMVELSETLGGLLNAAAAAAAWSTRRLCAADAAPLSDR